MKDSSMSRFSKIRHPFFKLRNFFTPLFLSTPFQQQVSHIRFAALGIECCRRYLCCGFVE
ncbi:hypothetical protein [Phytobacter diazotrophicus]|uniref:hypothetical protein n=1 Tax=Phytobacter diazotrophicus TaxID=395631 RepID=UPI002FEF2171